MNRARLTVDTQAFADALRTATLGVRPKARQTLRLAQVGGILIVTGPGSEATVEASGEWNVAVLVDAAVMRTIATKLPRRPTVDISVDGARLLIGTFGIGAEVVAEPATAVLLPLGGGPADVMRALARLGENRAAASFSRREIDAARAAMDDAIEKATRALGPFGVTRADVTALVFSALTQSAGS